MCLCEAITNCLNKVKFLHMGVALVTKHVLSSCQRDKSGVALAIHFTIGGAQRLMDQHKSGTLKL